MENKGLPKCFYSATRGQDIENNFITLDFEKCFNSVAFCSYMGWDEWSHKSPFCQCNAFFTALLTSKPKAMFSHFIKMKHKWIAV